MNICVDKRLKRRVWAKNCRDRRELHTIWIVEKVLLAVTIAVTLIYFIYGMTIGDLVYISGLTGKKNYFWLILDASGVGTVGFILVAVLWCVRIMTQHNIIVKKMDETIEILDNLLFYTFRIKNQTPADYTNLIVIDLNEIKNIDYDKNFFEISIEGMMLGEMVSTSCNIHEIDTSKMIYSSVRLFDYFTPSIYVILKSKIK